MPSSRPTFATLAIVVALSVSATSLTYAQSSGGGSSGGGSSGGASGGAGGASGGTAGGGPGGSISPSGGGASTNPSVTGPATTGAPTTTTGVPSAATPPSTGAVGSPSVDPLRRVVPGVPSTGVNPQVGVPNSASPTTPGALQPQVGGSSATAGGSARPGQRVVIDPLKQCLNDWDSGTHITRKRWAEICRNRPKIGVDTVDTPAAGNGRAKGARAYR